MSTEYTSICLTREQHDQLGEWAKIAGLSIIDELQFLMDFYRNSKTSPTEVTLEFDFYPYTLLNEQGLSVQQISDRNQRFNDCLSKLGEEETWKVLKKKLEVAMGCRMDDQLRPLTGAKLTTDERLKMKSEIKELWQSLIPEAFIDEEKEKS